MPVFCFIVLFGIVGCSSGRLDKSELNETDRLDFTEATAPISSKAWFIEQSRERGIDFVYESGFDGEYRFPEIVGGGAALLDFDNDGWLDLYLVQGGSWEAAKESKVSNQLYRNDGSGNFASVSEGSRADHTGYAMGVAAADFDGDGFTDLYITNVGTNVLLRNNGDGTFSDITESAGVGDIGWGTSAAFLDIDGDGWPDLYVCNYVEWSKEREIKCFQPSGRPDYCSPQSYNAPQMDVLYRNSGDGTFSNISEESGVSSAAGNGLGIVVGDFNDDGAMDVFVANDMNYNMLWINDGRGKFSNQALQYGCAVDRDGQAKAGMGTCTADISGNGQLDLLVVNLAGQSDSFFENRGSFFVDQTAGKGLAAASRSYTRFGVGFHDFDRDGWLDLFIANGRVTLPDNVPESGDPFAESNMLLVGSDRGRFTRLSLEESGDVTLTATSRAAVFGDITNNGKIDVVVVNKDSQCHLLINSLGNENNWIGFDARDARGMIALGAIVRLNTPAGRARRDVNPHYSYMASNDHRVHFGLGTMDSASEVEVHWPDGTLELFGPVSVNAYHVLHQGQGRQP